MGNLIISKPSELSANGNLGEVFSSFRIETLPIIKFLFDYQATGRELFTEWHKQTFHLHNDDYRHPSNEQASVLLAPWLPKSVRCVAVCVYRSHDGRRHNFASGECLRLHRARQILQSLFLVRLKSPAIIFCICKWQV